LKVKVNEVEHYLSLLAETPQRIATGVDGIENARLSTRFEAEEWFRPAVIRGRTHTVFSQTRRMALHEADHWERIDRWKKR